MATERTSLLPHASSLYAPPQRLRWKRKFAAFLALVIICSILISRAMRAQVPDYIDHEFGVGFDLTSPYGTAAISYPNGTVVNIAKVDASKAYRTAMDRLALDSSAHLHGPSYTGLDLFFQDQPRQALRKARREAGLPSSSDVGHLATLILSLRSEVETYLGRKISGAVATVPHLPAIYSEDLLDAFEYAGLIYIPQESYWWHQGIFPETGAAYVNNGFGTCANYTDIPSCKEEKANPIHQPERETILAISYSSTWLIATISDGNMGFSRSASDSYVNVKTDLGWERRNQNPDVEYYWEAVRQAILELVIYTQDWAGRVIAKVILYGDHAMDERFQTLVKDLVSTAFKVPPAIFQQDPTFSAARGAAEMAKRVFWDFNHTKTLRRGIPLR